MKDIVIMEGNGRRTRMGGGRNRGKDRLEEGGKGKGEGVKRREGRWRKGKKGEKKGEKGRG